MIRRLYFQNFTWPPCVRYSVHCLLDGDRVCIPPPPVSPPPSIPNMRIRASPPLVIVQQVENKTKIKLYEIVASSPFAEFKWGGDDLHNMQQCAFKVKQRIFLFIYSRAGACCAACVHLSVRNGVKVTGFFCTSHWQKKVRNPRTFWQMKPTKYK